MYEDRKFELIESLRENGLLHDNRLERAFNLVPLERFIPAEVFMEELLYLDRPQLFYFKSHVNRRTISAPHMICIMLEFLNLREKDDLLVMGSKSGYIAALASLLCSEGQIFIVESSEEVLELTRRNLSKTGFDKRITLLHGNPLTMAGTESLGKWNKILVPYQVEEHELYPALRQLSQDGGVLFAPIGHE
ncbi:MAG: protein-L-isoaspartate O-methyltransferase, partial [Candidatus Hodarchaeota archaeon]